MPLRSPAPTAHCIASCAQPETAANWRDEVPEEWAPLIEADEWLRESFDEFTAEYEPVPVF